MPGSPARDRLPGHLTEPAKGFALAQIDIPQCFHAMDACLLEYVVRLDLATQPDDVDVHGARLDVGAAVVPDVEQQVLARDDPVAVLDQVGEDVAFARRQQDLLVAAMRDEGFDIKHIHRTDRSGYKAGALGAALPHARGDFVAIFDADFVPNPDFLRRTVDYFQAQTPEYSVSCCQTILSPWRSGIS